MAYTNSSITSTSTTTTPQNNTLTINYPTGTEGSTYFPIVSPNLGELPVFCTLSDLEKQFVCMKGGVAPIWDEQFSNGETKSNSIMGARKVNVGDLYMVAGNLSLFWPLLQEEMYRKDCHLCKAHFVDHGEDREIVGLRVSGRIDCCINNRIELVMQKIREMVKVLDP